VNIRSEFLLESRRVDYPAKTEAELTSLSVQRHKPAPILKIYRYDKSNYRNAGHSYIVNMSETHPRETFRGVKDFRGYYKNWKVWMGKTVNKTPFAVSRICTSDGYERS
jgi:hypothetical protein